MRVNNLFSEASRVYFKNNANLKRCWILRFQHTKDFLNTISRFPISTRVDVTVYQHGKMFYNS